MKAVIVCSQLTVAAMGTGARGKNVFSIITISLFTSITLTPLVLMLFFNVIVIHIAHYCNSSCNNNDCLHTQNILDLYYYY